MRRRRRRKLHEVQSAKHMEKNEGDCLLSPATEIISSFTISSSTQMTKKFPLHGTRVFIRVATKGHK
jgi:hypothetical protein